MKNSALNDYEEEERTTEISSYCTQLCGYTLIYVWYTSHYSRMAEIKIMTILIFQSKRHHNQALPIALMQTLINKAD